MNDALDLNPQARQVLLVLMRAGHPLSTGQLVGAMGLSARQSIQKSLRVLIDAGLVSRTGETKAVRYSLANDQLIRIQLFIQQLGLAEVPDEAHEEPESEELQDRQPLVLAAPMITLPADVVGMLVDIEGVVRQTAPGMHDILCQVLGVTNSQSLADINKEAARRLADGQLIVHPWNREGAGYDENVGLPDILVNVRDRLSRGAKDLEVPLYVRSRASQGDAWHEYHFVLCVTPANPGPLIAITLRNESATVAQLHALRVDLDVAAMVALRAMQSMVDLDEAIALLDRTQAPPHLRDRDVRLRRIIAESVSQIDRLSSIRGSSLPEHDVPILRVLSGLIPKFEETSASSVSIVRSNSKIWSDLDEFRLGRKMTVNGFATMLMDLLFPTNDLAMVGDSPRIVVDVVEAEKSVMISAAYEDISIDTRRVMGVGKALSNLFALDSERQDLVEVIREEKGRCVVNLVLPCWKRASLR